MNIVFVPEKFTSTKHNKDFYIIRICLKKGTDILAKSQPVLWLTEEQYNEFTSTK